MFLEECDDGAVEGWRRGSDSDSGSVWRCCDCSTSLRSSAMFSWKSDVK